MPVRSPAVHKSRSLVALAMTAVACAGASFSGPARALAVSSLWQNGDGNWSDPTSWSTNPLFPNNGNGGNTYDVGISAGNVALDQDIVIDSLIFSGGTITGTNTLTINNHFTWSGGTLAVAAANATAGIDISGGGRAFLSAGTLINPAGQNATIGATGAIRLNLQNGATFTNAGIFTATNGGIAYNGGLASNFNNSGTLNVSVPSSTFTVGSFLVFNNTGTVNVQAGTLALQAGDSGSTTGGFNVSAGASLDFAGGNYTLAAASSIAGAGTVQFLGSTVTINGAYDITGNTVVSAATVTFNADNLAASTLTFSNGTIKGAGTLKLSGLLTWSAGTLAVADVYANGGIDFSGSSGVFLSGGTLTNALGQNAAIGTSGSTWLNLQNGAAFANDGTFTATNGVMASYGGPPSSFNNSGTFNVNVPAAIFIVGAGLIFRNTGTVNVQAGTLLLQAGDNGSTTGSFEVASAATLNLANSYTLAPGSSITGSGTLSVSNGTIIVSGAYDVTGVTQVSMGEIDFNAGNAQTAALNISGGTIGGSGALSINGPAIFTGGTLNITTANANEGIVLSAGKAFLNGGTLLVNNGTVTEQAGSLVLNGGTLGGYGSVSGAVVAGSGSHTIAPGAGLPATSTGTLTLGSLTTNTHTALAFNLLTSGTAGGSGQLDITTPNGLTLNGGTIQIANSSTGGASLGYYKIVQYSGAIGGAGIASLSLPPVTGDIAYTLDTTRDPGFIDLHRGFLGDANDDGVVDFADFAALSNNFGVSGAGWGGGDFNNDGSTNAADFTILSNNFGKVVGANEVAAFGDPSGVPEPASLTLLGAGLLGLVGRRRTPSLSPRNAAIRCY